MSPARSVTAARFVLLAVLACLLSASSCTWSFHSDGNGEDDPPPDGGTVIIVETATFGGWDLAPALSGRPGVLSVSRGWNGGALPFFGAEWAGWTGHARVVRVRFDTAAVPFAELVTAARAARASSPRVTVYAHSDQQRADARSIFPAESLPRLRLRGAGAFTPAH
jgi:hypothetical protein